MEVRAPGVVKLLGEHAVVYGKLAVAVAISVYAKASVNETEGKSLVIRLPDVSGYDYSFTETELRELFSGFKGRQSIRGYADDHRGIGEPVLPYATIAARLVAEHRLRPAGLDVCINSEIPLQKGFASSAACSAAFTVALLNASKIPLPDETVIDIAREGDRVIHKNDGAGSIDVSTSYYGGYVSYSASAGAKREKIDTEIELLLVDTGPKRSTAEMVGHVSELYKNDKTRTVEILDQIEDCSRSGIDALKSNDIEGLGRSMFADHALLARLGVSSSGLDEFVEFARSNGFYGAKLSGGGGGGAAIGLCADAAKMGAALHKAGFDARAITASLEGAKSFYKFIA
jgi:mevalonate kinase